MKAKTIKPSEETTDPVFKQHGVPFLTEGKKVTLNSRAVAVKCATMHMIKYNQESKGYERYDAERGFWVVIHEIEVIRLLDKLLVELGEEYEHQEIVKRVTAAKLGALAKMLRPHDVQLDLEDTTGLIHVQNGVVQIGDRKAKLLEHNAKFAFHHSSLIKYDEKATCPKFLKEFLGMALDPDDIRLLQMYCGSMLLGPNTCHGIMVIRGTPGGGKSTLVSIIEKIIGENMVWL